MILHSNVEIIQLNCFSSLRIPMQRYFAFQTICPGQIALAFYDSLIHIRTDLTDIAFSALKRNCARQGIQAGYVNNTAIAKRIG